MPGIKSHRQIWGRDFSLDSEWDAGVTPLLLPAVPAGRWTVRREAERFIVVFHRFGDGQETLLATFPPTEEGEIAAKQRALSAHENLQTTP